MRQVDALIAAATWESYVMSGDAEMVAGLDAWAEREGVRLDYA